jgi:hypothetical protein
MNYKEIVSKTKDKFQSMSFISGDTFSEMLSLLDLEEKISFIKPRMRVLSFWIVIISNRDGVIKTLEGNSGGLKLNTYQSPEEFKSKCQYKHSDGYWIEFMSNNLQKKSDFIEYYFDQEKMTVDEIREFKLNELGV